MDMQLPIQTGVYGALTGDGVLTALIEGVFDVVPEEQVFPFVTIGDITQVDDSTQGVSGMTTTLTVHTWDQDESRYKLKEIMGEVYRILHNQDWTLVGGNLINSRFEFSDVFKDPDGKTHHGVQRFRIVTDQ